MLWEELTAPNFEKAAKACEGVCILPIGVLEKHGNHLPLGTDMFSVTSVCKAAAEKESAIVFPYYFLGQITEARHYPGTIAASHRLMMDALLEMCDEISRNGLKKILVMSGHGGNGHFLPFFAQEMPRLERDYSVYTGFIGNTTDTQRKKIAEAAGSNDFGYHAGLTETAMMMYLRGDLVHIKDQDPAEGRSLNRLTEVEKAGLFTGFSWYANFPAHFAGDPTLATPELGEIIFNAAVENTVDAIKAIKADEVSQQFVQEYAGFGRKPTAGLKHS
ncbi:MAG: creatininase family protein [Defluviitaleaceae bacterium]|nr:creatininase family protein [Defluviitaleaceae bacterium]